jgi:hypothetical protein
VTSFVIPADAAAAEERFLEAIRARIAWQVEQAGRLRAVERQPGAALDVLDVAALAWLVEQRPEAQRAPEWRAFIGELHELADEDGRLPDALERLVRVVFAELL